MPADLVLRGTFGGAADKAHFVEWVAELGDWEARGPSPLATLGALGAAFEPAQGVAAALRAANANRAIRFAASDLIVRPRFSGPTDAPRLDWIAELGDCFATGATPEAALAGLARRWRAWLAAVPDAER